MFKEWESAQIGIKQHSYFKWRQAKAWKQRQAYSGLRRDFESIATKVCGQIGSK